MSIRYTLRHNIPVDLIEIEKEKYQYNQDPSHVNKKPYDFNLLRKHELAENTDHDIVFRTHDGDIVPIGGMDESVLAEYLTRDEFLDTLENYLTRDDFLDTLENYLTRNDFYNTLEGYQQKLDFVPYYEANSFEDTYQNNKNRPSNIALSNSFNYGLKGGYNSIPTYDPENPDLKWGFIHFGQQKVPASASSFDSIDENGITIDTAFGVIRRILTKAEYEAAKSSSAYPSNIMYDLNLFPANFQRKHLLSLVVTQEYDENISSSPLRVIPYYDVVNGENIIKGFWCIHDSSNSIKGYYVAWLTKRIFDSGNG